MSNRKAAQGSGRAAQAPASGLRGEGTRAANGRRPVADARREPLPYHLPGAKAHAGVNLSFPAFTWVKYARPG